MIRIVLRECCGLGFQGVSIVCQVCGYSGCKHCVGYKTMLGSVEAVVCENCLNKQYVEVNRRIKLTEMDTGFSVILMAPDAVTGVMRLHGHDMGVATDDTELRRLYGDEVEVTEDGTWARLGIWEAQVL